MNGRAFRSIKGPGPRHEGANDLIGPLEMTHLPVEERLQRAAWAIERVATAPRHDGVLPRRKRRDGRDATMPNQMNREVPVRIDGSSFGNITIDGTIYDHDVVIRLSGSVEKRRKKLSKRQYGTSHMLSRKEAKFVFEKGCDMVVIGSGQQGNLRLSPEAKEYFGKKRCMVVLQPTPDAICTFNRSRAHKVGLIHVTC